MNEKDNLIRHTFRKNCKTVVIDTRYINDYETIVMYAGSGNKLELYISKTWKEAVKKHMELVKRYSKNYDVRFLDAKGI